MSAFAPADPTFLDPEMTPAAVLLVHRRVNDGLVQKSSHTVQRGRLSGFKERLMTSPHPPEQFRQAHFLILPFSTSVSVPSAIDDLSGNEGLRSVRTSKSNRRSRRKSRGTKCLISAHHVHKRLYIRPPKGFGLRTAGAARPRLHQWPAFVSRMESMMGIP